MKLIFNKIYYIIYIEYDIMGSLSSCTSGARYSINKKRFNGIRSASFVCGNEKIKYFFSVLYQKFLWKSNYVRHRSGPALSITIWIKYMFRDLEGSIWKPENLQKNPIWCFLGRDSGQTEWSRPGELCKLRKTLQLSGSPAANICLCSTWNITRKFT